jgi:hypothetical protein
MCQLRNILVNCDPENFIISVLVCYLNFALDSKAWGTLNGGNNLIAIMLVYLIAMHPPKKSSGQPTVLLPNERQKSRSI